MESCGYSCILRYVENDYPGKTQNGGKVGQFGSHDNHPGKEGGGGSGDTGSHTCRGVRKKSGSHD